MVKQLVAFSKSHGDPFLILPFMRRYVMHFTWMYRSETYGLVVPATHHQSTKSGLDYRGS